MWEKIENLTTRALPNRVGHEMFARTMDITCPREDNMNPFSSVVETQSSMEQVESGHHGYFFKTENTLHIFQKNDKNDGHFFIEDHKPIQQHNVNNNFPVHYNANSISPKGDLIFVKDYEKKISEISSQGFQLHPHDFWWVIWATLLVVGALILILILLMHTTDQNIGGDCSPYKSRNTKKNPHHALVK